MIDGPAIPLNYNFDSFPLIRLRYSYFLAQFVDIEITEKISNK